MNRKQKIILWLGIGAFTLIALFPPWVYHSGPHHIDAGYSPIWKPATVTYHYKDNTTYTRYGSIDFQRLGVQWVVVAVLTGGLVAVFASRKKESAVKSV